MKKGAILAISLGFIALLTSIIYIFLSYSVTARENYQKQYNQMQLGSLFANLSNYVKSTEIDDEMLYYASKMQIPIELGDISLILSLKSANDKIPLNSLLEIILDEKNKQKDEVYGKLSNFLIDNNVNNPAYYISLLLDTYDKDMEVRSNDTEISLMFMEFYNGSIVSIEHLNEINDYYALSQNDFSVYDVDWESFFTFDQGLGVDINYASYEVLNFLFPDANIADLQKISKHDKWYETVDDLPFDSNYRKTIVGSHFGVPVDIKSSVIDVSFELENQLYTGKISFYKTMSKKSKIYNIRVNQEKILAQ